VPSVVPRLPGSDVNRSEVERGRHGISEVESNGQPRPGYRGAKPTKMPLSNGPQPERSLSRIQECAVSCRGKSMLAFTDTALAHLMIACTAVPPGKRSAALRALAREHDPSRWARCRARKNKEQVRLTGHGQSPRASRKAGRRRKLECCGAGRRSEGTGARISSRDERLAGLRVVAQRGAFSRLGLGHTHEARRSALLRCAPQHAAARRDTTQRNATQRNVS